MKLFTPEKASAQCVPAPNNICLLEPGVVTPGGGNPPQEFEGYAKTVYDRVLGFIIIAAILMIVFAGVQYAASAAPGAKANAKERGWSAIWGLVLALVSYLILYIINPDLLTFNIFHK